MARHGLSNLLVMGVLLTGLAGCVTETVPTPLAVEKGAPAKQAAPPVKKAAIPTVKAAQSGDKAEAAPAAKKTAIAKKSAKSKQPKAEAAPVTEWSLLPMPRKAVFPAGEYAFAGTGKLLVDGTSGEGYDRVWLCVNEALELIAGSDASPATRAKPLNAVFRIDPMPVTHPQGYTLTISAKGIEASAYDEPGLFYAAVTLRQIARQAAAQGALPYVEIEDWPDFPNRGVLLDITREKVPEMDTLYAFVDKMADWKLNQLQMYTEHVFAYRDHHTVWEDASPMTPAQIRSLDAYCKARCIDLVPNQNSFGHMDRWLQHPQYKRLGEMPDGGSDLCPTDPACEKFLEGLYADLLPNFSSRQFNVCCDETWSIGKGRSKKAADEKGVGRVYLEFLMKIYNLVKKQGRTMQFWGDIIMQHPELIPELPKDVIAMEWGYEAEHPFADHGKKFAESRIPFYVVPGSSAWNSLAGRTDNAVKNLVNASENGRANGAIGFIIADWGDGGHWQFLPVSYLGFAYGAAVSWASETNKGMDIPHALDVHSFGDSAGVMGRLAYDLGNAYKVCGFTPGNDTVFYMLLQDDVNVPIAKTELKNISLDGLQKTLDYVNKVMVKLPEAKMTRPDANLIVREYQMTANLMRFSCHLGIARMQAGGVATKALPVPVRQGLAVELEPLIPEFRQLWLMRNRSGGLKASTGPMEALLAILKAP